MAEMDARAVATRLVRRTGFGARPDEIEAYARMDLHVAAGQIVTRAGDPGAAATPVPNLPLVTRPADTPEARKAYQDTLRAQRQTLMIWWLDRMVASQAPWREKRTFLWHDIWATSIQKIEQPTLMLRQNETLRNLGSGDFRDLARTMVRDPALMLWLDAAGNTRQSPNENLARELMELFTIGVGSYTEDDVRQAAKALTGWRIDRYTDNPTFDRNRHSPGTQTILGVTKDFSDQDLVDLLVDRPDCPRYLTRRLWSRLVSETEPAPETLTRISGSYWPDRNITRLCHAILTDAAFRDPNSVVVKMPVEYVVGTLRAFGLRPSRLAAADQERLRSSLQTFAQLPFAPPSVGGWPSGTAWLTTTAARTRLGFAQWLAEKADLGPISRAAADARPDALAKLLGLSGWTARTRTALQPWRTDPRKLVTLGLCAPEYLMN